MAATFSVVNIFKAKDKLSKPTKVMNAAMRKFGITSKSAFDKASRSGSRFGDIVKGVFTANILSRGVALITQGLRSAITQFISFDQAITASSAKFKDMNLATKEGQKTLLELKKTARAIGAETQFSATQAAGGLDFLAMAGFNSKQAMASLRPVVDLATVANVDLARATDIASDTLGAFGMMTNDTAKLQKNFTRVNDVMAKTMTSTNVDMEMMFETIKKAAPDFEAAGQSIETFSAFTGIMANAGKKGSEAGTVMRNFITRLAKPTAEASGMMKKLGIKTADSSGNFLDATDILEQLQNKLKGMGDQQRAAAVGTIFGARAQTGINILLKAGVDDIRKFRNELMNSAGASKKMAAIMRQSLQNRIASLMSALTEFGFKIIDVFAKKGGSTIDALTNAIRKFDPTPIIDGLKFVVNIITKAIKVIKFFWPVIRLGIKLFIIWKVATIALSAVMGILNFILLLNPIGLIVIAVTALIAGFVLLVDKAGGVGNAFMVIGKVIMKAVMLPINLVIWSLRALLFLISKIPGVGSKVKPALEAMKGFQEKINKPFEITEFEETRARKKREEAVKGGAEKTTFEGRLEIAGAPAGSVATGKTKGPGKMELATLGVNP